MSARRQQTALTPPRKNATLADAIRAAIRDNNLSMSTAFPASVVDFDGVTNLLNVKVDFSNVLQLDAGEQVLDANVLPNILLSLPGQGEDGGGYLSFPIKFGAKGHVTVFDRSVDRWIERGEGGDPEFRHTHNRIDGVFTPGLRDKSRAIGPGYDDSAAVLEHDSIKLGASAVLAAARETDSVSADVKMILWIEAVNTALKTLGITVPPPTDFGLISSGSSKVKIQ